MYRWYSKTVGLVASPVWLFPAQSPHKGRGYSVHVSSTSFNFTAASDPDPMQSHLFNIAAIYVHVAAIFVHKVPSKVHDAATSFHD